MIVAMLLATALAGLGELRPQTIRPGQCLTFLWSRTEPAVRVAMLDEGAGLLRIVHRGQQTDLRQTSPGRFAAGALVASLDLTLETRPGMASNQQVADGVLLLDEPGQDSLMLAVGGLKGCAPVR